jgi:hypothetical protein
LYLKEIYVTVVAKCRLKYMKKFGNVFLWPEKSDMSQELTENIISKLENPQLVVSLLPVANDINILLYFSYYLNFLIQHYYMALVS